MAATIKRNVTQAPAVAGVGVNFGDLGMYVQGGGLPEGDYALVFGVQMFDGFGQKKSALRLGVMVECSSLNDPSAEVRKQFYSMGSQADKSFAPNPETGKGIVPVPGGPGATMNNSTNWAIFLKSLYDSGLPQGVFTNDLSVLDGINVHMQNIPEPAERATFAAQTGEAAEERKAGVISIVTEIKDDGKPWEGTGGIPAPGAAKPKPVLAAAAKPALSVKPQLVKPPAPAPVLAEVTEDDVVNAAISGTATVLEKNPNGVSKLLLKTGTFNAVKNSHSEEMAQAVQEMITNVDEQLNAILSQHGYTLAGAMVKLIQ